MSASGTIIAVTLLAATLSPLSPEFELSLNEVRNAQGDYSFYGLEYGDSFAEVEAALGVEIPNPYGGTEFENFTPVIPDPPPAETGVFPVEETVSLKNFQTNNWEIYLDEDGFYSATIYFSDEDVPDLYLDTVKELTDLYGVCRWNFERGPLEFSYIGPCIQEAYNWAEEDGDTISVLSVVLYMNEVEDPLMIFSLNRVPVEIPDTLPPGQAPPETLEPFDFSMLDAVS